MQTLNLCSLYFVKDVNGFLLRQLPLIHDILLQVALSAELQNHVDIALSSETVYDPDNVGTVLLSHFVGELYHDTDLAACVTASNY